MENLVARLSIPFIFDAVQRATPIVKSRYEGFFGRVKANMLIEEALKFGCECHGVNLRSTVSSPVRIMVREHIKKPGIPQTKEEVFFALVVTTLPSLDAQTLLQLFLDIEGHADIDYVSREVRGHFMAGVADLGPDQRAEINKYTSWQASRER